MYVAPLLRAVARWKRATKASALFSVPAGDALFVWDLRPVARHPLTVLRGLYRALHETCDASTSSRVFVDAGRSARDSRREEVERALETLVVNRLLLRDGERHLALAVSLGRFSPEGRALDRFWRVARSLGERRGDGIVIPVQNGDVTFCTLRACARPEPPATNEISHAQEILSSARFSVNRRGKLAIT